MSLFRYFGFYESTASASVPGEGCTWIILFGTFLVQMTVPSVLSIYAVVLGYLATARESDFDLWAEKIIFTPILFAAFWSLEDPWSRAVIDMAPVPRLVGVIGVALLAIGFLASGYLATGGVGAYLASLSAGAVMGIGASFLLVHAENVLWRYYKARLPFALFVKNIANSIGYILVPVVTYMLLLAVGLRTGLLVAAILFVPTIAGALLLRPPVSQRSLPYTLLLLNETQEISLPEILSPENKNDVDVGDSDDPTGNSAYSNNEGKADRSVQPLFGEGQDNYFYDEPDEEVNIFINPASGVGNTWKQEFQGLRSIQFWMCAVTCSIVKVAGLYFWMLLPSMLSSQIPLCRLGDGVILLVIAGFGTLIPAILFYCHAKSSTIRHRRLCFAAASWLGGAVFLGFTYCTDYVWFVICALFGGVSICGTSIYQHTVVLDFLGNQVVRRVNNALSTVTGTMTLLLCFTYSVTFALRFMALLQIISGLYWMVTAFFTISRI